MAQVPNPALSVWLVAAFCCVWYSTVTIYVAVKGARDIRVRGYVSCVLGCPYEGEIAPERVALVARLRPARKLAEGLS